MLFGRSFKEVVSTAQGSGNAITAAAATSLLTGSAAQAKYTFPANYFSVIGQQLNIRAAGIVSTVITTPGTLRFDFRLGGTVVFDGLAILPDSSAAYSSVGWFLDILLTLRVVGTAAQFFGQGFWTCTDIAGQPATPPKGALTAILPWNSNPGLGNSFDATTSLQGDLFFTQTVTTGSVTLNEYELSTEN